LTRQRRYGAAGTATFLATALLLALAPPATAITTLEGYSDMMTVLKSGVGGDPSWELENPRLYAELRLKTSPWTDIDTFLKVAAESSDWVDDVNDVDSKRTDLFLKEGHLRFRGDRVEAYLFTRQDRFWLNEPLLGVLDQGQVKDDSYGARAQGIRLDFWDTYGLQGAFFYSDKSNGYDHRAGRVSRFFAEDRIVLGSTYARADYQDFDEVIAFDGELAVGELVPALRRFGRVTWATEYGRNTSRDSRYPGDDGRNGIKTELRDVKVGPFRFLGSYEDIGTIFYTDELSSGDNRNKNGYTRYYAEAHYRVPTKAVNLKGWTYKEEPKAGPGAEEGTRKEWGTEAYLEFVNGFTGKVEYKYFENRDGIWPNLFTEVTGENRLVKLVLQYRIKDMNADYELTAYGFGVNVNLSENWKFYARVMNVDELTESRQTAFAQLRYLGWSGAEFFVEFGNPDQSNDFVNDGDFVNHDSGATTEKVFKAFVRIYY